VIAPDKPFQPNLMFVGKAMIILERSTSKVFHLGRLLTYP